jgi:hypothetical protein
MGQLPGRSSCLGHHPRMMDHKITALSARGGRVSLFHALLSTEAEYPPGLSLLPIRWNVSGLSGPTQENSQESQEIFGAVKRRQPPTTRLNSGLPGSPRHGSRATAKISSGGQCCGAPRFGHSPGAGRWGAETGTEPALTFWYMPLESNIGPAERRPALPGILTPDRDQRRKGPAKAAMGTTASRRSGRRSSRLTNLLRSDDTEAISSEAPDTAWPGSDSGRFYTFVTLDP